MRRAADTFARTGHAELDDALALLERAHDILDAAGGSLEDAHVDGWILSQLEIAQDAIVSTAVAATRRAPAR